MYEFNIVVLHCRPISALLLSNLLMFGYTAWHLYQRQKFIRRGNQERAQERSYRRSMSAMTTADDCSSDYDSSSHHVSAAGSGRNKRKFMRQMSTVGSGIAASMAKKRAKYKSQKDA